MRRRQRRATSEYVGTLISMTANHTDIEIESAANQLRAELSSRTGEFGAKLPLSDLVAYLAQRDRLSFSEAPLGKDVVGIIEFAAAGGSITLDAATATSPIASFTLAHEIGHWVLHRDSHKQLVTLRRDLAVTNNPTEREANRFAVHLLMPSKLVTAEFTRRYGSISRAFEDLSVSARERWNSRREYARFMASKGQSSSLAAMDDEFGVSSTAMAIRLEELALV